VAASRIARDGVITIKLRYRFQLAPLSQDPELRPQGPPDAAVQRHGVPRDPGHRVQEPAPRPRLHRLRAQGGLRHQLPGTALLVESIVHCVLRGANGCDAILSERSQCVTLLTDASQMLFSADPLPLSSAASYMVYARHLYGIGNLNSLVSQLCKVSVRTLGPGDAVHGSGAYRRPPVAAQAAHRRPLRQGRRVVETPLHPNQPTSTHQSAQIS